MKSFPKVRYTTGWFMYLYFGIRSQGTHHIPETGPFVVLANHASYLDPYMIGYTSKIREVGFMAKEELFKNPLFGWIIHNCGAFPVKRGKQDAEAIQRFHDFLNSGKPLCLYPEGTRTLDGELQTAKKGVGMLLYNAKVLAIPAYIDGTYKSFPKGSLFPKPGKVTVFYGPAVPLEDLYLLPPEKKTYQLICERVMAQIAALKPIKG